MLAPVPVAAALGLGGAVPPLDVVSVLSMNGTVVGVSQTLGETLRGSGHGFGFDDAAQAGRALSAAMGPGLRVGVPFPLSMHAELLHRWLGDHGAVSLETRAVPPPLMAEAMAAGEIDAFCVGEPWGSVAVEGGVGELLLPGAAIWAFAPEKVLALRRDWLGEQEELAARLVRAVWRAGRWLAEPANHMVGAEILARPDHVDVPAELLERALSGRIVIDAAGLERRVPRFVEFHHGAAHFPWRSQAAWIGARLASRFGLPAGPAAHAASAVFRSDLHRRFLECTGADLPGASSKIEGAVDRPTPAASRRGRLVLMPDLFFDRRIFDPLAVE
jgi:NitT/TauT family transport system ATP-binding protein